MKKRHWSAMAAVGLMMGAAGCAADTRTVRMSSSDDTPAAQGTVKASPTKNDNTMLEVEVRHLAPPGRVAPGATTYVVWVRAAGQDTPQNLGALRVDKDLRGSLQSVTPLRSFDVFITAEPSPTTMAPTSDHLLAASIQRRGG